MTKSIYLLTYEYQKGTEFQLFSTALDKLGFEPKYVSVFYDEFQEPERDFDFDKERLLAVLDKTPHMITVQNQQHSEAGNNFWFKFGISDKLPNESGKFTLEWSNSNLDFLLNDGGLTAFLRMEGLLFCYCYDQFDCFDQSDTDVGRFLTRHPSEGYKTLRGPFGDAIIDTSEHWGRCVDSKGLRFMAAPLMWFGERYSIISKAELLQFRNTLPIDESGRELVHIKLFDLYAAPSHPINRSKQKDFWQFFNLQMRISEREEENAIEFGRLLKERALQRKQ